jgi:hypothetical protein
MRLYLSRYVLATWCLCALAVSVAKVWDGNSIGAALLGGLVWVVIMFVFFNIVLWLTMPLLRRHARPPE